MTTPAQRVPPFPFLVGCGRSGTTLLRAMCDSHPDLAVPPESHFIVPLAAGSGHPIDSAVFLDRLYAQERFRLWELDRAEVEAAFRRSAPDDYAGAVRTVFSAWAATQGKIRYADKTPGYVLHIPMLARLFPESVFVHLVRDGRDVACSFLELGWADTVEEAALHWRLRVLRGRQGGLALPSHRYHELRYEDLVADPEGSLRRLCDVMSVPFSVRYACARAACSGGCSDDQPSRLPPPPQRTGHRRITRLAARTRSRAGHALRAPGRRSAERVRLRDSGPPSTTEYPALCPGSTGTVAAAPRRPAASNRLADERAAGDRGL